MKDNKQESTISGIFSPEDYKEAREYLIDIGQYDEFQNNRTSTDGYSLVAYANAAYLVENKRKHYSKPAIIKALKKHNGVVMRAAATLGLTRGAIYRRLSKEELQEIQEDCVDYIVNLAEDATVDLLKQRDPGTVRFVMNTKNGYVENKNVNSQLTGEYTVNVKHSIVGETGEDEDD